MNERRKRFCDYYMQTGNASESAIRAGYSKKTAGSMGFELLKKPEIITYIKTRAQKLDAKRSASMEEVQEFWADTMRSETVRRTDRLKASELIARTQGAFLARVEHSGSIKTEIMKDMTDEQLAELAGLEK